MTALELRKALKNYPDNAIVVLAKDPEGNGFRELFELSWDTWDADDCELSSDSYGDPPCVVLWP